MTDKPKLYPKWVGLVFAFFLPGSAHYLSGHRKAGMVWFFSFWALAFAGTTFLAIPLKPLIITGFVLIILTSTLLPLIMLIRSFRAVPKLKLKGWMLFIALVLAANLAKIPGRMLMPVHPFQVPTGSMEPTLMGISAKQGTNTATSLSWLTEGSAFQEFQTHSSGTVSQVRMEANLLTFDIGSTRQSIPSYVLSDGFKPEGPYNTGDIIWSGTISSGDHIMVNRKAYLFKEPARGDIIIVKTDNISHPEVRPGTVYIKRIAGLPGETIRIETPRLIANGSPVTSPALFENLKFRNAGQLKTPADRITLAPDEYLVTGDNQSPNKSLDGRYFGAIKRDDILGKVSTIYWPFNRIGAID